ncbi:MBL fold metallo-hydrolase [Romboutsia sp. 1001216sp1]|uniref:ComEC/Rec2 family competence protein n=1 Tax=Romboutsia TaxID=1501226 RepID=UPI000B1988A4|nr:MULTISPECIES: MBL fold metallo-hydrolase [Romboutsia]MDB8793195.1 MBL fold metallo-hydrolase [Romboutsia sp. 1001216sp1]MDB8795987.1 MBL fold metallo-hydrolase [Romboutsia sp. 1001216sp1]MDB8799483.1 MBL fold metallo-hydrolase [Romboutsia sp. 1001216sp1]
MGYELEFIGVNEETKDATSICVRWKKDDNYYVKGVFDGGFKKHGEQVVSHLNQYYLSDENDSIDFVICSHPHKDHSSGLKEILENVKVKTLYMNRPWVHIESLYDKVNDGRITKESLKKRLKESYTYISELESIAEEKNIPIFDIFQGDVIENKLTVLSPSKEFYLDLLVESNKTPLEEDRSLIEFLESQFTKIISKIKESWSDEKLREDVETEPDNETSTVILGDMDKERFLLTGDAGIRALREAIDYSESISKSIKENVQIYEMPHHGGRHNVSPSILNDLLGDIVTEGELVNKKAFVCSGKNSDHPLQMVVNAFIRRGVKVYNASGNTIRHSRDMDDRSGWTTAKNLAFNSDVEEWH